VLGSRGGSPTASWLIKDHLEECRRIEIPDVCVNPPLSHLLLPCGAHGPLLFSQWAWLPQGSTQVKQLGLNGSAKQTGFCQEIFLTSLLNKSSSLTQSHSRNCSAQSASQKNLGCWWGASSGRLFDGGGFWPLLLMKWIFKRNFYQQYRS
jgi:hypothetical protein